MLLCNEEAHSEVTTTRLDRYYALSKMFEEASRAERSWQCKTDSSFHNFPVLHRGYLNAGVDDRKPILTTYIRPQFLQNRPSCLRRFSTFLFPSSRMARHGMAWYRGDGPCRRLANRDWRHLTCFFDGAPSRFATCTVPSHQPIAGEYPIQHLHLTHTSHTRYQIPRALSLWLPTYDMKRLATKQT